MTPGIARALPPWSRELGTLGCFTLALGIVAFLVLYPAILLFLNSFEVGIFGQKSAFGIDNWKTVFSDRHLRESVINTLTLTFTRQAIALAIGIPLAWLVARTNLPGRHWIEFGFWVALFLPALPVTMAWMLLLGGRSGLINTFLRDIGLESLQMTIYSWWGIVWLHLVTSTLPVKVFLLAPAFRNMDAALEEASRTSGATTFGTMARIVIPILAPTILAVVLLGIIRSMQAFEVELILGTPASIDVYSTIIYRAISQQPPLYGVASVMAMSFLGLLIPFIVLQQWLGQRRGHATVTGKFSARLHDLGRWKWPLFWVMAVMIAIMTVLPIGMLLMGSFMKLFGHFNLPEPWTTNHWVAALGAPRVLSALNNTLLLGAGSAVAGMIVFSLLAYMIVKTRFYGRHVLDFLTWLPTSIPGIVISLGFLFLFVGTPIFRPLYGTMWVLIIAVLLATMTVGVQIIKGALLQLGNELEEASWVAGASWVYTFWHITIPLVAPAMAAVGLQIFATAVSVVGIVALIGTGANQPLSILQLIFLDNGRLEPSSVVGIFVLVLTLAAALLARYAGMKSGIERHR